MANPLSSTTLPFYPQFKSTQPRPSLLGESLKALGLTMRACGRQENTLGIYTMSLVTVALHMQENLLHTRYTSLLRISQGLKHCGVLIFRLLVGCRLRGTRFIRYRHNDVHRICLHAS